jgi:hypothetical protein
MTATAEHLSPLAPQLSQEELNGRKGRGKEESRSRNMVTPRIKKALLYQKAMLKIDL